MSRSRLLIGALAGAASFVAVAQAQTPAPPPQAPPPLATTATIKTADGASIGTAVVTEAPGGVLVRIEIKGGLKPGWHGMHFHAMGDCTDPKFLSSGGHIQMAGMKMAHGLLNPGGPDDGDLPNLYVQADGTAKAEVFSSRLSLKGADGRSALLDADGSALVIHADPDDQMSQPIGGAGARVACGVIR